MGSRPSGEMTIRLSGDCEQRQERRVDLRMGLSINRLRGLGAMLLAEFRALLVHSETRSDFGASGGRDRSRAIHRSGAGMRGHRELQEQQRAQAQPGNIFSARSAHNTMITRLVVNLLDTERQGRRTATGSEIGAVGVGRVLNAPIDWLSTLRIKPRNRLAMMPPTTVFLQAFRV